MLFPSWSSSSSDIFGEHSSFSPACKPLLTPMRVLNSHFWGSRHTVHCFWTLSSESFEPDLFCCVVYAKVPLSNLQDPKEEQTRVCSPLSLPVLDGTEGHPELHPSHTRLGERMCLGDTKVLSCRRARHYLSRNSEEALFTYVCWLSSINTHVLSSYSTLDHCVLAAVEIQ